MEYLNIMLNKFGLIGICRSLRLAFRVHMAWIIREILPNFPSFKSYSVVSATVELN